MEKGMCARSLESWERCLKAWPVGCLWDPTASQLKAGLLDPRPDFSIECGSSFSFLPLWNRMMMPRCLWEFSDITCLAHGLHLLNTFGPWFHPLHLPSECTIFMKRDFPQQKRQLGSFLFHLSFLIHQCPSCAYVAWHTCLSSLCPEVALTMLDLITDPGNGVGFLLLTQTVNIQILNTQPIYNQAPWLHERKPVCRPSPWSGDAVPDHSRWLESGEMGEGCSEMWG